VRYSSYSLACALFFLFANIPFDPGVRPSELG
jgi:hypothetical protein